MTLKAAFKDAAKGSVFKVLADETFEGDFNRWCAANGCQPHGYAKKGGEIEATIVKGDAGEVPSASKAQGQSAAIVVFSNDLDKVLAALILANGLAASGSEVGLFFTFWGLSVLRKNPPPSVAKNFISRILWGQTPK